MELNHTFKFGLNQVVATPHVDKVLNNGDQIYGTVVSRSQNGDGRCDQYMVRHINNFGHEVEEWFSEDRLLGH